MAESTESLDRVLTLADGRRVGCAEWGDPAGVPVFLCHGFPASRLEGRLMAPAAARAGARLIALDRPGYGLSDWQERRTLLAWPEDIRQVADQLGIDRFSVLGVSGGAPYALAVAYALPERVRALGIVCGLGPVADEALLRPMHWPARFGFGSARHAPWLNRLFFGWVFGTLMQFQPDLALKMLTVGMRRADQRILSECGTRAAVCAALGEGLRQGTRGALWDMKLYAGEWGFDPAAVAAPVDFWHGTGDATVPLLHTEFLSRALPGAGVHILAEEGHFSLPILHADPILEVLLSR